MGVMHYMCNHCTVMYNIARLGVVLAREPDEGYCSRHTTMGCNLYSNPIPYYGVMCIVTYIGGRVLFNVALPWQSGTNCPLTVILIFPGYCIAH